MGCLNEKKNQILIADQTEGVDLDKKSTARDQRFRTYFWEVDHPLWEIEWKKLKFLLLVRSKEQIGLKKVWLADKKSTARDQTILHIFLGS